MKAYTDGYDLAGVMGRGAKKACGPFGKQRGKFVSPGVVRGSQHVGGYPSLGVPVDVFGGPGDACGRAARKMAPSVYHKPKKKTKGKFATAGFKAFCLYVRATMALVVLMTAPVLLLCALSRPVAGAEYTWARTVPYSAMKRGGRVRLGLMHRMLRPTVRQMYAYMHVLLFNLATFTLLTYALSGPIVGEHFSFGKSVLWALAPTAIMFAISIVYHYASWYMKLKDSLPARRAFSLIWRGVASAHDRADDSAFNLMFREQIRDAMSMSSLARCDRQLLVGIPTALFALGCYVYDRQSGEEDLALNFREAAAGSKICGLSVDTKTKWGLFRD
ncbi:hypothetical protein U370_03635 [Anaplasma marginale str. Dawn]|uniref:hypothetical protein n=1 Tax=Anaplasma marginale TaxID=770 RepID=UPI00031C8A29|nr:hypothetical protein [Anaplasma marginale]AGZ79060.1 hypothetical protein U128_03770 [Anaplasma marginale str. Gypsy Plains]AGZ79869.1 hypothetical protein U370_03635 [Anaplasma marginale str. Dawn]KAA8472734.1 hypothetical protein F0Q58_01860 [Anaplasma marginale]KAB0450629.1 hypothetical protein FY210_03260 [Anaplasma marginale]